MIQLVLIILVAVVVLIAVIGGLAWYYLRGDDDTGADPLLVAEPEIPVILPALRQASTPTPLPEMQLLEPQDGDAYAAELHAIGQAAATDEWLEDLFRPRRYMVEHWTREEIIRRYAPLAEYQAWVVADAEAFRARLGFVKVGRQLVAVGWRQEMGLAA